MGQAISRVAREVNKGIDGCDQWLILGTAGVVASWWVVRMLYNVFLLSDSVVTMLA